MEKYRIMILHLLAQGRIDAAQAERLLASAGAEREIAWAIAGCAVIAAVAQLQWLEPGIAHVVRAALSAGLPSLQRGLSSLCGLL
jgi:hypothetical protein